MIFPVVLLQDYQGTLEQVLLLAVVAQVSMRIAQICQSPGYFRMIFPVVLLQDYQGTLEQVLFLPAVAQVSMRIAQICQSPGYFRMIFPVVLLQDYQGTLEQVLLLAVVAQVSMRIAQICQSPGYFQMFFPVVLLLDYQGTLEQVLLLAVVAQVSMRSAQICQSHCYTWMCLAEILDFCFQQSRSNVLGPGYHSSLEVNRNEFICTRHGVCTFLPESVCGEVVSQLPKWQLAPRLVFLFLCSLGHLLKLHEGALHCGIFCIQVALEGAAQSLSEELPAKRSIFHQLFPFDDSAM